MKALKELITYDYQFKVNSNQLKEESEFQMVMKLDKGTIHTPTFTYKNIAQKIGENGKIAFVYLDKQNLNVKLLNKESNKQAKADLEIGQLTNDIGSFSIDFKDNEGLILATLTAKYMIKDKKIPTILFENFQFTFIKKQQYPTQKISYAKINVSANGTEDSFQSVNSISSDGLIKLSDNPWLNINKNSEITISCADKQQEQKGQQQLFFSFKFNVEDLKASKSGGKKYKALGNEGQIIGQCQFYYTLLNMQQESKKNTYNQILCAKIQHLKYKNFKFNWENCQSQFFVKFQMGKNTVSSKQLPKSEGQIQDLIIIYCQDQKNTQIQVSLICEYQNKEPFIYCKSSVTIDQLASKNYTLNLLAQSQTKIQLYFDCTMHRQPCVNLAINNIVGTIPQNNHQYGQLHNPYIVMRVGTCSAQTEVSNQHIAAFKTGIQLTFSKKQTIMYVQLWDKFNNTNRLVDQKQVQLSNLSSNNGDYQFKFANDEEDQDRQAEVNFNYQWKGYSQNPQEPVELQTVKQQHVKQMPIQQSPAKQQFSQRQQLKQQSHKKQPLKQQSKKQQSKRQPVKQQPVVIKEVPINQSRTTLVLPQVHKGVYGNAIYDKQSATTLQKSISAFSVPKAIRFGNDPKYSGEPAYSIDTSFKLNTSKGAGFGFGNKKQFPDWLQRNMKENPSPGAYLQTSQSIHSKGPTFGLSHKYYAKVLIKHQKPNVSGQNSRKLSPISFHHRI